MEAREAKLTWKQGKPIEGLEKRRVVLKGLRSTSMIGEVYYSERPRQSFESFRVASQVNPGVALEASCFSL